MRKPVAPCCGHILRQGRAQGVDLGRGKGRHRHVEACEGSASGRAPPSAMAYAMRAFGQRARTAAAAGASREWSSSARTVSPAAPSAAAETAWRGSVGSSGPPQASCKGVWRSFMSGPATAVRALPGIQSRDDEVPASAVEVERDEARRRLHLLPKGDEQLLSAMRWGIRFTHLPHAPPERPAAHERRPAPNGADRSTRRQRRAARDRKSHVLTARMHVRQRSRRAWTASALPGSACARDRTSAQAARIRSGQTRAPAPPRGSP